MNANEAGPAVATAGDAGEPGEPGQAELDAETVRLVKQWPHAISTALAAVAEAQAVLGRLQIIDPELAESREADEAGENLGDAAHYLKEAAAVAAARHRTVTDAERDAELIRLRAENSLLAAALAEATRE